MTKIESDAMLVLLNVTMEPSNVRKKVREPPNVRNELSHMILELYNVRMKSSNVRKKKVREAPNVRKELSHVTKKLSHVTKIEQTRCWYCLI